MSTLTTLKELVIRQLSIDPDISLKACQKVVPGLKKSNFYKIKKEWKEESGRVDTTKRSVSNKDKTPVLITSPSIGTDHLTIEDPNELLKHVCVEQLIRTRDVKWGNLLFQMLTKTNELSKITNQGADTELAKLSISSLVSKLREKSRDARSEETSLPSGNMQNQST